MHFFFSYFSDTLMTAAPTRINGDIESHQSCVSEPSIMCIYHGSLCSHQYLLGTPPPAPPQTLIPQTRPPRGSPPNP